MNGRAGRLGAVWVIIVAVSIPAFARTHWVKSEPFTVTRSQSLSGEFVEYTKVVWPFLRIRLMKGNKVVRETHTDNSGNYDLGVIEPGSYHLEIAVAKGWCPPKVNCDQGHCAIEGVIRWCAPMEEKTSPGFPN